MEIHYGTDIIGRAIKTKSFSKDVKDVYDTRKAFSIGDTKNAFPLRIWRGYDKKCVSKKVKVELNHKAKAYENDLYSRRMRLKNLLDNEEQIYKKMCNIEMNNKIFTSKRENLIEDVTSNYPEEEEFLANKILQLDLSKCEEIRPLIIHRREADTRKMQEMQIKEKEIFKLREKEKEKFWHDMMIKDIEIRESLEISEKEKHKKNALMIQKFLKSQIKLAKESKKNESLLMEKEEKKISENITNEHNEMILFGKTQKNRKTSALHDKLIHQIDVKQNNLKKDKQSEIELEKSLITQSINKHEADIQRKIKEKERLQKEINLFNEHLLKIQTIRKAQFKHDDNFVGDVLQKQLEKEDYHRNLFKERRKELLQNAISGRDVQIQEKKRMGELENEIVKKEIDNRIKLEQKISQEKKNEKDTELQTKIAYKKDLEEQIISMKKANEKLLMQIDKEENEKIIEKQKRDQKCMEFMKKEFNSESIHPFTKIVKNHTKSKETWYSFIPETKYIKY